MIAFSFGFYYNTVVNRAFRANHFSIPSALRSFCPCIFDLFALGSDLQSAGFGDRIPPSRVLRLLWKQASAGTPTVLEKKEGVSTTIEELKALHYEVKPCEEEDVESILERCEDCD